MVAAYRFCENENTGFDSVLQSHIDATRERMAAQPVALLVQDTSEIDVTRPGQPVAGAGPLDGDSRRGALLHLMHAFTPDGTPLGSVFGTAWIRDEEPVCASLSRAERAAIPIEEKESHRWVTTLQQAREEARRCPATQLICVADSEADIYEVLVEGTREPRRCDWILRLSGSRLALRKGRKQRGKARPRICFGATRAVRQDDSGPWAKSQSRLRNSWATPTASVAEAEVVVRVACVTLRPPWRADRKLPPVTVNVVLVSEVNPPPDDQPVEWLLLTSLPIDSLEQVRQIIQDYCVRWMIEIFFRVLKSGCRVEERLFEYMDRLLTCLAVYVIVAWRTLYVCRLGRSCPEMDCEAVFEPAEWKSVWKVVHREDPPHQPPTLGVFIRLVARLGGYVDRKRAGPPGPQTLWIGLQRMHDFATCWQLFGPDTQKGPLTCV